LNTVIPKQELKILVGRFLKDKQRGISIQKFADLCGISREFIADVFIYESSPMSETTQRRVSAAYQAWREGRVRVMRRKDQTQFVDYRKIPEPAIFPHMGIVNSPDGFKLSIGPRNRHDYSYPTLDES
jgi:hypothetical protein